MTREQLHLGALSGQPAGAWAPSWDLTLSPPALGEQNQTPHPDLGFKCRESEAPAWATPEGKGAP